MSRMFRLVVAGASLFAPSCAAPSPTSEESKPPVSAFEVSKKRDHRRIAQGVDPKSGRSWEMTLSKRGDREECIDIALLDDSDQESSGFCRLYSLGNVETGEVFVGNHTEVPSGGIIFGIVSTAVGEVRLLDTGGEIVHSTAPVALTDDGRLGAFVVVWPDDRFSRYQLLSRTAEVLQEARLVKRGESSESSASG